MVIINNTVNKNIAMCSQCGVPNKMMSTFENFLAEKGIFLNAAERDKLGIGVDVSGTGRQYFNTAKFRSLEEIDEKCFRMELFE